MFSGLLYAQKQPETASAQRETVAKPLTDKERRKREAKLRKELEGPYRKWLNEDVAYIITDEERTAFKRLQTDDEKQQFIEQFWLRPTRLRTAPKTNIKKSTTAVLHMRTSGTRLVYPAGRPTEAGSTSLSVRQLKSSLTLPAEVTSGRSKRAAAPRQRIPSKSGDTGTLRVSATTS